MPDDKPIRISEIFGPTIQGEGALIGRPTVFVRTGGCDYRCAWCDTLHAVDSAFRHEWAPMSAAEIFAKIKELSSGVPVLVSLSGGNPAIQDLGGLIAMGKAEGYSFALETQGSVARDWFADLDVLTLSPKPPSSGMITDWAVLAACVDAFSSPHALAGGRGGVAQISLKFVIFDDTDYRYAKDAAARYPALPVYLQPGNHVNEAANLETLAARLRWLADKVTSDRWFTATVLPQLHVIMWGNKRGV